ncbi:hypothetical protein VSR68_21905 [Paraburkholderia phymatum]|uniref:hypothetical protein n=1 Tax=Paraburkholderia phymatum TaxID=148447 RepID=UPI00317AAC62
MGLLRWLFNRERVHVSVADAARIDEAVERILAIHPRLKLASHYRRRLKRPVAATLQYVDELIASLPATLDANAAAWSSNPCLRAFFATPEDIARAFGRSEAVRTFFEQNPDAVDVHGTLGMALNERHVLGVAMEGDTLRHDVVQTTLSFSDHRVRICGRTEPELREELVRRLIDQMALEGLSQLATDRAERLARGRELMQERVALLHRQGTGIRAVVGGDGATPDELSRVQAQIAENADSLAALRVPTQTIELDLKGVCEVLSKPSEHVYVKTRHIRIDMMNVIQKANVQGAREIEFHFARIPGPRPETRAFALVRFSRSDLPPGGLNIDATMRAL